jgi:hypothetical protein
MNSGLPRIYSFYGFRLESELPLALISSIPSGDREQISLTADIVLVRGEVLAELPDPVWTTPFVSVDRDGSVLIRVAAAGRFLVRGGNSITVDAAPSAAPVEIEAFLMGPVAGALLHQRGTLPLHASCVETGGAAIALTGSVGRGKSTLAAALVRRGARLMSDDICPIIFSDGGVPFAVPGSTGLRLRSDTRKVFGCDGPEWLPIRPGHAKHVGRWNEGEAPEQGSPKPLVPRRLGAVIRLTPTNFADPAFRRLRGPSGVSPMQDLVYRLRIGRLLGRGERLFRDLMRVADKIPVFEMQRPNGFEKIGQMTDLILGALEGDG